MLFFGVCVLLCCSVFGVGSVRFVVFRGLLLLWLLVGVVYCFVRFVRCLGWFVAFVVRVVVVVVVFLCGMLLMS